MCYGDSETNKVHINRRTLVEAVYISKGDWPAMRLQLKCFPGKTTLSASSVGSDFCNVDLKTSLALTKTTDSKNPRFRTQARIPIGKSQPKEHLGKEYSEYFNSTVTSHGPKLNAQPIRGHASSTIAS